jgi:hypothetical protein
VAVASICEPHLAQKRASSTLEKPQLGQKIIQPP